MRSQTVLCAPDKFRGTATADEVVVAVASAAEKIGWLCDAAPMADGGEGTIDVVDGERMVTVVTGPVGGLVSAPWTLSGDLAILEMAQASGHIALGDAAQDALNASTRGTGELIAAAIEFGAKRIVVGAGGSVTTDGGLGAVEALRPLLPLQGIELVVATDVRTTFVDCARMFGPQKGALPSDIPVLEARLVALIERYRQEFGVDVSTLPGGGAAGGLAGGLAAIGGRVALGFPYLAELVDLEARVCAADLVITGEGKLDIQSTHGKVVDGVFQLARKYGKSVLIIAGVIAHEEFDTYLEGDDVTAVSLVESFGRERALNETVTCVGELVRDHLQNL